MFVVDLSESMDDPCESGGSESCLTTVLNVIDAMSGHYDWANYGLVGTSEDATTSQYERLIPLWDTAYSLFCRVGQYLGPFWRQHGQSH